MKAIILCTRENASGRPIALTRIGGISVLERQARILKQTDVKEILIVATGVSAELTAQVARLKRIGLDPMLHDAAANEKLPSDFISDEDERFFLCDGSSVYDYTMPTIFDNTAEAQLAAIKTATVLPSHAAGGLAFEADLRHYYFAGIAKLPVSAYELLAPKPGDDWLREFLHLLTNLHAKAVIDISQICKYDYDMRRDESCMWLPITDERDNPTAKRLLLDRAQKSVLDWPAWYIHRPIEKAITYYLCELPITPNQITLINIVIAFGGIFAFAKGQMTWGLLLALVAGIVDGLDGKQARVKVQMTKIGKFEELSDRIYEYGWYVAIAYWLANTGSYTPSPYSLFAALFFLHGVEVLVGYVFKLKRHVQLDDFGPIERRFRLIGSRRNTNMWALIPFVLSRSLYAGLWMLVIYYGITVAFKTWRMARHLKTSDTHRVV